MGELVLGTLHPLARLSNVSMGMVVPGHGMAMMILPWQPHVLQSVVVTLPLLRTAQPPTGMGAATVLALSSPTPALKGRQGWLCVMQQPLPGYPPPSLIVLLGRGPCSNAYSFSSPSPCSCSSSSSSSSSNPCSSTCPCSNPSTSPS